MSILVRDSNQTEKSKGALTLMHFERVRDNEVNGGKVLIAARSYDLNGLVIQSSSPLLNHHLKENLSCPIPLSHEERTRTKELDLFRYQAQQERYIASVNYLTEKMLEAICDEVFGGTESQNESRMGESFTASHLKLPELVLGEIARGGTIPTLIADEFFRSQFNVHAPKLYAASQRRGTADDMTTDLSVKGKVNLSGKTLLILEQALATGTTIDEVLKAWCVACDSAPAQVVVGAIHASPFALRKIPQIGNLEIPKFIARIPVDLVVMFLHGGMNEKGYLTKPGCGDVGAMGARASDT